MKKITNNKTFQNIVITTLIFIASVMHLFAQIDTYIPNDTLPVREIPPGDDDDPDPEIPNLFVGALPGAIDVSPTGAATYSIPIEVVPGTQGIQPNLSIVYNSMGGMGLLGMKWSLAGLSAITRCGQTPYYDNNITGISFGSQSRFALDGERLINVSGGYHTDGAVYATEMENFNRIISHGYTAPHSFFIPESFTAYTDDGSIIEYGSTDNSRLIVENARYPIILSWYIDKITDANGNYMTYHYGSNDSEIWIDSIKYTGNTAAGIQTYAKVSFKYQNLPDKMGSNTCYVGGYKIPQTKLLQYITVSYGNSRARLYEFSYNVSQSSERTTHLKKISLRGETNESYIGATTIDWGTKNNNIEVIPQSNFPTGEIIAGDFNGDGYSDYVVYNQGSGTTKTWKLFLFNPNTNSFEEKSSNNSLEGYAYSCDFDGDGKDELVLAELHSTVDDYKNYQFYVWHYDNNVWTKETLKLVNYFSQPHFADFTGDGITNIMYVSSWKDGNKMKYKLSFSNNGNFSSSDLLLEDIFDIQIIDYNGNGKANISIAKGSSTDIYAYSDAEMKFNLVVTNADIPTFLNCHYGDFNGDGITDIILCAPPPDLICINYTNMCYGFSTQGVVGFGKGNGYYEFCNPILDLPYNDLFLTMIDDSLLLLFTYSLFIVDVDGDDKDDIIHAEYNIETEQTTLSIYYSKGFSNGKYQFSLEQKIIDGFYSVYGNDKKLWQIGNYNNDGKKDILIRESNDDTNPKIIYLNKNEQYEFVKEITDGMGKKVTVTYTPNYLSLKSITSNQRKILFACLPTQIQMSNGIGNGVNTLKFKYENPMYSFNRRSFAGFSQFVTINPVHNTTDSLCFQSNSTREMILPQYRFLTKQTISNQISYYFNIVSLSNSRFILHNNLVKNQDFLSDTKIETTTTLEDGRIKTSNTKTFNGSNSSTWLHSETNTYTYQTLTLSGSQKKTVPTKILSTQQYGSNGIVITDTVTYNYSSIGRLNWQRQGNIDGSITTTYGNYTTAGLCQEKTVSAAGCTSRKEYYEYDNTNRFITKLKNHLLHENTMTYNAKTGNILTETNANELTTTYTYDTFGRLKKINYPDGTITKDSIFFYSVSTPANAKYCTKTTSTGKPELIVYYDILGREVCRNEDGYYYETKYNNKGQVVKNSYPFTSFYSSDTVWNYYTYDNLGRVSEEKAPYTHLSYSYNNRKVTVTDHLRDNTTSFKDYDALGRMVQAKDEGGTINYYYSVINSLSKPRQQIVISTNGTATTILSDLWGNRLSLEEPNAGKITSTYNKFNELIKQKDARGNTTTYQYDVLGRITQKIFAELDTSGIIKSRGDTPDDPTRSTQTMTINYTYDNYSTYNRGRGKIYQIILNNAVEETFNYDKLSRLSQHEKVIDYNPFSFYYEYTPAGQLGWLTYPDDFTVKYSYSPTGKLEEIRNLDDESLIYKVVSRNQFNAPTLCEYGNGTATEYTYNEYGLLTRINTGKKNKAIIKRDDSNDFDEPRGGSYVPDSSILNYRYAYNNRGLMNFRSESVVNMQETFTYDNLDRLTGVIPTTGSAKTFSYLNNGNIDNISLVGDYNYLSSKPHSVTKIETVNGNVISAAQSEITYNFFNQPNTITEGNFQLDLFYGSNQQRNMAIKNGDYEEENYTRFYVNKFYEKDEVFHRPPFDRHYHYIYGDNGVVALQIDNGIYYNYWFRDSIFYIHTDHLGSYCAITNINKQVVKRNYFDPWGNIVVSEIAPDFTFPITTRGFTGHEHYPFFKIINMNGRLYDPVIGRFLSPDNYVLDFGFTQSYNRYSYARNNPLKYIDLTGEWEWDVNIMTGFCNQIGDWGGFEMQRFNLFDNGGVNWGQIDLPGSTFNITPAQRDDFGNYDFYISCGDYKTTQYDGIMFSEYVETGYFHLNIPAESAGNLWGDQNLLQLPPVTQTQATDAFNYRVPASGMITYSPFNVEDVILLGMGLYKMVQSAVSTMITNFTNNTAKTSAQMIADMATTKGGTYSVYQGLDAAGTVKYVGITSRTPAVRFAEHAASKTARSTLGYEVIQGAEGLTKTQARILEQQLINQNGLGNLLNLRNSIDPKYWWLYDIKP